MILMHENCVAPDKGIHAIDCPSHPRYQSPEGTDYPAASYTNGELRALVSPVFGVNHERIRDLAIVVVTDNGIVGVHTLRASDVSNAEMCVKDMRMLVYGILNILDDLKSLTDE